MHQNNSQLYSKKEIKFDLKFLNLLFPLKYHPTTLERQFDYLKWFATMSLRRSNDLSTMLCHQSFLVQCLLSTCWKLLPFQGPYIYDTHTEGVWGSLEICHVFADSIVFKQQIYCSFLQMLWIGGQKIGHFFWTP